MRQRAGTRSGVQVSDQHAGDQIAAFPQRRHFGALIPIRSVNLFIDPLLRDKFVQHIQIYVCKQRRQDATLRCSFFVDLALIHNTSLEHLLDDLQQSPILDAHMIQAFQEDAVIDPVKAFGNITFHNPMPSILVYRPNDSLQGHLCIAHRTESIGVLIELSLHNGFQNDSHTFLHNSISYGFDLFQKIQEKLTEILKAIQFPGAASARLNTITFDIEVNGKQKANVMGGGFCGILNSVVLLAIREVLYESGAHTPGILILDSALTQLSETQYGEKANVIRDSFIQYLLDHQESGQVIFIDQKEKMPTWLGEKSKCKYHEFTKARGKGRYGLLYDVYDEE